MIYLGLIGMLFVGCSLGFMAGCSLTYRNNNLYKGNLSRFNRVAILRRHGITKENGWLVQEKQ